MRTVNLEMKPALLLKMMENDIAVAKELEWSGTRAGPPTGSGLGEGMTTLLVQYAVDYVILTLVFQERLGAISRAVV